MPDEFNTEKEKSNLIANAIGYFSGIVFLWVIIPWISYGFSRFFSYPISSDYFNVVGALFSGAAIVGVVLTVYQQQLEMEATRKEMRVSSNALNKQVELTALSAKLQSIPIMINIQKQKIETLGGVGFLDFSKKMPTIDQIKEYKNIIAAKIASHQLSVDQFEPKKAAIEAEYDGNPPYLLLGGQEHPKYVKIRILENAKAFSLEQIDAYNKTTPEIDQLAHYIDDLNTTYSRIREFEGSSKMN